MEIAINHLIYDECSGKTLKRIKKGTTSFLEASFLLRIVVGER